MNARELLFTRTPEQIAQPHGRLPTLVEAAARAAADPQHGGRTPGLASPDILARTGAFPEPDTTTDGRTAYPTSKPAAIRLVHEYARRLPAGINAVAYNPGHVPAPATQPLSRFTARRTLS